MEDPLVLLQQWYRNQCDGEWEHQYGIEIGTLDNPGWRLKVDLVGTAFEGTAMERRIVERSEHDWLQAWSDGTSFNAAAGPCNLTEAVDEFLSFARLSEPAIEKADSTSENSDSRGQ